MLNPIIEQIKQQQDIVSEKKSLFGLIDRYILDAKGFFSGLFKSVTDLKDNTFSVRVENQVSLPEVQKVDGAVSLKEIRLLLVGLKDTVSALEDVKNAIDKGNKQVAKELKPEKIDLAPITKAIENIPEVEIPEHPESVSVNNFSELKKSFDDLAKKVNIKFPEIVFPEFPKSLDVNNLKEHTKAIIDAIKAIEMPEGTDVSPVVDIVREVKASIDGLVFPVPNFQSSWNHSLDMQSNDSNVTVHRTSGVVDYLEMTNDGGTYRKTITRDSSGNATAISDWSQQ